MQCPVVWWGLWNFMASLVEFNRFLHPNEPHEKIFLNLVRGLRSDLSKIGHVFTFFRKSTKLKRLFIKVAS